MQASALDVFVVLSVGVGFLATAKGEGFGLSPFIFPHDRVRAR